MKSLRKRILSFLTAAAVVVSTLGALPVEVFPRFDIKASADAPTEITTWAELSAALASDGEIELTQDITATATDTYLTVPSGVDVTLDLNGYTIDRGLTVATDDGFVIKVEGKLTLKDTGDGGKITGGYNNNTSYGGGVYVTGEFEMYDGEISGNKSEIGGGGVYVTGEFTMTGGKISGNTSTNSGGGGVFVDENAAFTMDGGTIGGDTEADKNTARGNGGGVFVDENGAFTMNDGKISHNTSTGDGGGVRCYKSTFIMNGGTISENTALSGGGAIISSSEFTMSGGMICGNNVAYNGGGVLAVNTSIFTMSGGAITDNTSGSYGGGVHLMNNSTIKISGSPIIYGNKKGTTQNNVNLPDYTYTLKITGALGASAVIGVTEDSNNPVAEGDNYTVTDSDAAHIISDDSSLYAKRDGNNIVLASIGDVTSVSSWADLSDKMLGGGAIKLGDNVIAGEGDDELLVPSDKFVFLDLSGHTINRGLSSSESSVPFGNVITFSGTGTLVLTDSSTGGKITGGNEESFFGGGINVSSDGTLVMLGGTISNNVSNSNNGGGGVYNEGTMIMLGGDISNNKSSVNYGGGVCNKSGATFTMLGGTIKTNTANNRGGGVYVEYGSTFNILGSPVIQNNTALGRTDGVELADSAKIKVLGKLSDAAKIGVLTTTAPADDSPVQFAEGFLSETDTALFVGNLGETVSIVGNEAYLGGNEWAILQKRFIEGGRIKLTADAVALPGQGRLMIDDSRKVILDLNGYTIDRGLYNSNMNPDEIAANEKPDGCVIIVDYGTLIINDTRTGGKITGGNSNDSNHSGGGIHVGNNDKLILNGGSITENRSKSLGGGVYVALSGKFIMNGGSIYNNTSDFGGGVFNGEFFTMSGGSIYGNTAENSGGGVENSDTFTMSGGSIYGNSAVNYGGGVIDFGTFNISGSPVINNNTNGNAVLFNRKVFVTEALTSTAKLGVTLLDDDYAVTKGAFTEGLRGKGAATNFTSDEAAYIVTINDDGEAELVDKPDITYTHVAGVSPDCINSGMKEHYKGSDGKLYSRNGETYTVIADASSLIIPALGHDLHEVKEVPATCTTPGKSAYYKCRRCKKLFSDDAGENETTLEKLKTAPLGHDLDPVEEEPATCLGSGVAAHFKCKRCEKLFSDDAGENETKPEKLVLKPLGHNYVNGVCTRCGATLPHGGPSYGEPRPPVDWDEIIRKIKAAPDGGTVNVNMNGTTTFPGRVVEVLKDKNVFLVLEMNNDAAWTINGTSVTKIIGDINMGVVFGRGDMTAEVIDKLTGGHSSVKLRLLHNGEFGFTAVLSAKLQKQYAGQNASLYCYDKKSKSFEHVSSAEIKSDGTSEFTVTHASDYLIVIGELATETAQKIVAVVDESSMRLKWDAVPGATSYTVYKSKNGKWVELRTTAKNALKIVKLKNNKTYRYMVRATVGGKLTAKAESYIINVKICYKPVVKATEIDGKITLNWTAVNNATKYGVFRYSHGEWKLVKTTEKLKYSVKTKSGKTYKFAVCAFVNDNWTAIGKTSEAEIKTEKK